MYRKINTQVYKMIYKGRIFSIVKVVGLWYLSRSAFVRPTSFSSRLIRTNTTSGTDQQHQRADSSDRTASGGSSVRSLQLNNPCWICWEVHHMAEPRLRRWRGGCAYPASGCQACSAQNTSGTAGCPQSSSDENPATASMEPLYLMVILVAQFCTCSTISDQLQ